MARVPTLALSCARHLRRRFRRDGPTCIFEAPSSLPRIKVREATVEQHIEAWFGNASGRVARCLGSGWQVAQESAHLPGLRIAQDGHREPASNVQRDHPPGPESVDARQVRLPTWTRGCTKATVVCGRSASVWIISSSLPSTPLSRGCHGSARHSAPIPRTALPSVRRTSRSQSSTIALTCPVAGSRSMATSLSPALWMVVEPSGPLRVIASSVAAQSGCVGTANANTRLPLPSATSGISKDVEKRVAPALYRPDIHRLAAARRNPPGHAERGIDRAARVDLDHHFQTGPDHLAGDLARTARVAIVILVIMDASPVLCLPAGLGGRGLLPL